jgi:carboxymethylenebutenolidase
MPTVPLPGAVTDPAAVVAEQTTYHSDGTAIDAYVAGPANGAARRGGLIVIHEAFGPNDHIADLARRFANIGFDVIAPNLYTRDGAPTPGDMASVFRVMLSLPDAQVVADLEAAAAYLRALPTANGKVGCIGFCSGGRHTLLYACSSATVDAAVDCWGGFIDRAGPDDITSEARPTPVIEMAEQLHCPLFIVGGENDMSPTPELVARLEARLLAAGKTVTAKVFDGVGHAFLADYRESYNERAAHELWPMVVDYFTRHLA